MKVYPSILTDSLQTFKKQLEIIKQVDEVTRVQVDIIDGQFADNLTVTPADLTSLDFGKLELDFHLMTEEPMDYVHELIELKSQLPVNGVIAQVERMSHVTEFLKEVKSHGWQPGLSLDLHTPLEAIDRDSLEKIEILQLMGVEAGHQGQQISPQVFTKAKELTPSHDYELILDGGVKLTNLAKITQAKFDSVVIGSAVWRSEDPSDALQDLIENCHPSP